MMRILIVLVVLLMWRVAAVAQDKTVDDLVSEGIKFHDQGQYDQAIASYQAALKMEKDNSLANYELALTYFVMKRYEEAIKYSSKVVKLNTGNQHEAYLIFGNALDMTGKSGKATKVYKDGLKKFPESNLLYYNLGVTLSKVSKLEEAEDALTRAVVAHPAHGSSHVLLAEVMRQRGKRIQSLMALYYFLLLEPNSSRSGPAYTSLRSQLLQGTKKDDKNITISVVEPSDRQDDFQAADMVLSFMSASRYLEVNKNKNDYEMFVEETKVFISLISSLTKGKEGFWNFYVSRLGDLEKSGYLEAFSYYISQSTNASEVNKWIENHSAEIQELTALIPR